MSQPVEAFERTIQLFLVDGTPSGLIIASIHGWTGSVLVATPIRALARSGLAVLFTTHDPNQAYRYADRALLMRDGRCFAEGAVAEVLTRERLEALYGAKVEDIAAASGQRAFLPG